MLLAKRNENGKMLKGYLVSGVRENSGEKRGDFRFSDMIMAAHGHTQTRLGKQRKNNTRTQKRKAVQTMLTR